MNAAPSRSFAIVQGIALTVGAIAWVGWARGVSLTEGVIGLGVLGAAFAAWLAWRKGWIGAWEVLMLEAGAAATATSALGMQHAHWVAKPLAMVFALAAVAEGARRAIPGDRGDRHRPFRWLAAALAASLAGDVFLMLRGLFIPGLVSFLVAHLCYLVLLRRGVPWFGHRPALFATLALAVAMYTWLWLAGLPTMLRAPVAAYVLVIAAMAAQAWSRQRALATRSALLVALGACSFMASDSLLAINRFVTPLPWSPLLILPTYYAAQALIVHGMLNEGSRPASASTSG